MPVMAAKKSNVQTIETLTERFQNLDKERTRVQALLGQAESEFEQLLEEAERDYGTRDLKELKSKLKELESENLKMREQYQKDLDTIEKSLTQVESRFDSSELDVD